jgi:polyphosphate glucokinase
MKRTLCIDIGGTGLKALVVDDKGMTLIDRVRIETPRPATPRAIVPAVVRLVKPLAPFDRVSVGFPGVVIDGTVRTAPNLDGTWANVALAKELNKKLGKPVRALNDAGVQGLGVIQRKGVEMVITLGTGMGCALYVDGRYVPNLELAHHPFREGRTYEEWVGNRAREKVGNKKWNKRVRQVLRQIDPIWNPRRIYLGGGNAKHLDFDPKNLGIQADIKVTSNVAGLLGGIALWSGAN